MEKTNFSSELFSYQGEAPDFLPTRLRLPDGRTRRPSCITAEEIALCGYIGPLEIPKTNDDSVVFWDSINSRFSVKPAEDVYTSDLSLVDRAVRKFLESLKLNARTIVDPSPEYVTKFYSYLGAIEGALSSERLLNYSDVPEPIDCYFQKQDEKEQSFHQWAYVEDNISTVKRTYETTGLFVLPESFSGCLNLPEDWVYTPGIPPENFSRVEPDGSVYATCSGIAESPAYGRVVFGSGFCLFDGTVSYDGSTDVIFIEAL